MLTIILTILITENLLLLISYFIWTNRHCKKCQKPKCLERVFNKLCFKCNHNKEPKKDKEKFEIF